MHEEVVVAAAEAGKHVICEKPLTGAFLGEPAGPGRARRERARALDSLERIRVAVERAGVRFCYAENWIYAPSVTKTKRLLDLAGGGIIDIRAEESHSGSHAARSRARKTAGGGALMMLGSHPIAAAIHLKEHESRNRSEPTRVVSVTAETAALADTETFRAGGHGWLVSEWDDVETWANVVLGFSDGTRAVVTASFAMLGGVRNTLEVYTTNGAYRNNMTPNDALVAYTPDPAAFGDEYLHEKIETRTGWITAAPDEDWVRGYPQEMRAFMTAVRDDEEPASGLRLAADVVATIYAAYVSADEGRRVRLDAD